MDGKLRSYRISESKMSKPNVNAKENGAANVKENGNPNGNGNGNAVSPKVQEMLRKNNEQRDRDQKFVELVPDVRHILDFSPANCERVPNRFNPKQMRYRYSIQDPENPNKEFLEVSVGSLAQLQLMQNSQRAICCSKSQRQVQDEIRNV
jgi:hypothetical protein